MGPISPASILAIINDQYVRFVSEQYGISKNAPAGHSFETNIVDVAALFSMNKGMVDLIPPRARLEHYQDMIS
jgi:hypothetical protein